MPIAFKALLQSLALSVGLAFSAGAVAGNSPHSHFYGQKFSIKGKVAKHHHHNLSGKWHSKGKMRVKFGDRGVVKKVIVKKVIFKNGTPSYVIKKIIYKKVQFAPPHWVPPKGKPPAISPC